MGLFGILAPGGEIKNLSVYGNIDCTNGGGVFYSLGGKLSNVNNYVNVTSYTNGNKNIAAGLATVTYLAGSDNIEVVNCANYGDIITGADKAAGLIGSPNAGKVTFVNSANFGKVKSIGQYVGGFIGYADQKTHITLIDCINYGEVIADNQNAGGVIGRINHAESYLNIDNFKNFGNVTSNKAGAGGVSAYLYANSTVTNSVNYGDIKTLDTGVGNGVAGFHAYVRNNESAANLPLTSLVKVTVDNCKNYGDITSARYSAGGIIGWEPNTGNGIANAFTIVTNCVNYGDIASINFGQVGGIAGILNTNIGHSVMENCVNYGSVTGGSSHTATINDLIGKVQ